MTGQQTRRSPVPGLGGPTKTPSGFFSVGGDRFSHGCVFFGVFFLVFFFLFFAVSPSSAVETGGSRLSTSCRRSFHCGWFAVEVPSHTHTHTHSEGTSPSLPQWLPEPQATTEPTVNINTLSAGHPEGGGVGNVTFLVPCTSGVDAVTPRWTRRSQADRILPAL